MIDPKYFKEQNFPDVWAEHAKMHGKDIMTADIHAAFIPTKKDDPDNMEKAQYSLRERFGMLTNEDY